MPKQRYRVTMARKRRSTMTGLDGWEVRVNGSGVGTVMPIRRWDAGLGAFDGWYFSIRDDKLHIPRRNTAGELGVSEADAKKSAIAYVKECLRAQVAPQSGEDVES